MKNEQDNTQKLIKKMLALIIKAIIKLVTSAVMLVIIPIIIFMLALAIALGAADSDSNSSSNSNSGSTEESGYSQVEGTGTYTRKNIPQAVLDLEPKFKEAAKEYGIEEYLDVLLAICTQESHGTLDDCMQCGASSKDESIKTGTRMFSEHLRDANYDLDIALQAYNFGGGFIKFAKDRGGYSKENADAFAKIHSGGKQHETGNALGTWKYGDQNYVEHVKQYFTITQNSNNTNVSASAEQILNKAKILHQKLEDNKAEWSLEHLPTYKQISTSKYVCCANYVSAVLINAGCINESSYTASAPELESLLSKDSKFEKVSSFSNLQAGDIVFMTRPKSTSGIGHVQIYAGNNKWYNTGSTDSIRQVSPKTIPASYIMGRYVNAYRYK